MKLKGLVEKHILRKATGGLLPPRILDRTKQPYRAPDSQAFMGSGELDYVRDCLNAKSRGRWPVQRQGRRKASPKMQHQPVSGFRDNAAFVGILSTQLWQRNFAENGKRAEQAA